MGRLTGPPVSAGLHENIDDVAVLAHRAPEILALPVDGDEELVQMPRIAESPLSPLEPPRVVRAELLTPLPNGFVRHDDAPFGGQFLHISETEAVAVVDPDRVADDVGRKAMSQVAGATRVHSDIVPAQPT